jgi:cell fate regulator YaaT (PSP1 superfamily)
MIHISKRRERQKRPEPPVYSIEVSVVGAGFEKYQLPNKMDIPRGAFLYIKPENEQNELLVKARHVVPKPAEIKAERIRPASKSVILQTFKNMARAIIWENNITDLKIVDAELDLEVGYIKFVYIAEKRYNLNKLLGIKLAHILHLKVDFKQIGARDYARKIGGIGICGREVCCKTFMKQIPAVTLEMARQQYLFAVPEKLSGICGRLMCCLRYELPMYEVLTRYIPATGTSVMTEKGKGRVVEVNLLKQNYKVRYEDGTEEYINVDIPDFLNYESENR